MWRAPWEKVQNITYRPSAVGASWIKLVHFFFSLLQCQPTNPSGEEKYNKMRAPNFPFSEL